MTDQTCGAAHPNFTGVFCRMSDAAPHAMHVPEGFSIGNANSPQPWKNAEFVVPRSAEQTSVEASAVMVTRLFQRALREQGER